MPEFVKTHAEFQALLKDKEKVAVDFTASWCGPCQFIGPKFAEMAGEEAFAGIHFCKVDVDGNEETAQWAGIQAMPTFKLYKGGEQHVEVVGASEGKLREALQSLASA